MTMNMTTRPEFSVVIPAYNEGDCMRESLGKIIAYLKGLKISYEIIVVDDGSRDNTPSIIQDFSRHDENIVLLKNDQNQGKGFSIRKGMLRARGKYILFTDVDLSVPMEELSKFIFYLDEGYDVVIGSRRINGSQVIVSQPFYRRFMGTIFYQIVYLFLLNSVRDTNCGFKCYRNGAAKEIFNRQTLSGWGFDTELLYISQKLNYRVKEVPVRWFNCSSSKVKILKVPFLTLLELFKIKMNDWKGRYR